VIEEHRMRAPENKALIRIFRLKGHKMMGGSGKLHTEELRNLYSLPSIIRMTKARKVRCVGPVR
jgi:hypothetical protein